MIVLGIETATPSGGIAIVSEGEGVLASQCVRSSRAHSRLLMPAVEMILGELGLGFGDIDAIAVSRGPGSFTGVRVGLSLAKALCAGASPRLTLVSTLESLALRAWRGEDVDCILPLLNARQGEVYGAVHAVQGGCLAQRDGEEFVCPPDDLPDRFAGRCLIAGEGALAWRERLLELLGDRLVFARADSMLCSPEQTAWLGLQAALRGEFADPVSAQPAYLREASTSKPRKRNLRP